MFTRFSEINANAKPPTPKEGDLFKVIELHGNRFEIRYGYYEEIDGQFEPIEIYPDFLKDPVYTKDGYPFVTLMQAPCEHYKKCTDDPDHDCSNCKYMERGEELIAVCRCPHRKRGSSDLKTDTYK